MRLLLDTHAFLWFVAGDQRLSKTARDHIEDQSHELLISIASLWEMAVKVSLGKLDVPRPFAEFIRSHLALRVRSAVWRSTRNTPTPWPNCRSTIAIRSTACLLRNVCAKA